MYFEWSWISELAKVAWISFQEMESIVNNHISFRKYTDTDWVEWKKCKNCLVWKELYKWFNKRWINSFWNQVYDNNCKSCRSVIRSNIKKLMTKDQLESFLKANNERSKKSWNKNREKYNQLRKDKYKSLDLFEKIKVKSKRISNKRKYKIKLKHNKVQNMWPEMSLREYIEWIYNWNHIAWNISNYNKELAKRLIVEEHNETLEALDNNNFKEVIDWASDSFIVLIWEFKKKWIDPNDIYNAMIDIMINNFSKFTQDEEWNLVALKDEQGKIIKPAWFEKVDLSYLDKYNNI